MCSLDNVHYIEVDSKASKGHKVQAGQEDVEEEDWPPVECLKWPAFPHPTHNLGQGTWQAVAGNRGQWFCTR